MRYYTLEQLIIKKYGSIKYSLGMELVKQWMNVGMPITRVWTHYHVINMVAATTVESFPICEQEAEKLKLLFNLQSTTELFAAPESNFFYQA